MFEIIELVKPSRDLEEPMGTKPKFWLHHERFHVCLWKEARAGTGEDWSEKIACELAGLLGLPHALYHMAQFEDKHGTISEHLLFSQTDARGRFTPLERMIHGNELLYGEVPDYPTPGNEQDKFKNSSHTLENVFRCLERRAPAPPQGTLPKGVVTAADVFVGYLLLDAWIGNTDRHHGNWAFIEGVGDAGYRMLSPTYDHASCLGCHLRDDARLARLQTTDAAYNVETYSAKARSALYEKGGDAKPMLTRDAFADAARRYPAAADAWRGNLSRITENDTMPLFARVPRQRMSDVTRRFAECLLQANRKRLLE